MCVYGRGLIYAFRASISHKPLYYFILSQADGALLVEKCGSLRCEDCSSARPANDLLLHA